MFGRDILEDVAQVEPVNRGAVALAQEFFERLSSPFEPMEIGSNGFEILRAQGEWERRCVPPGQNPLNVRIVAWIESGERITRPRQDAPCHASFDVLKKIRVASEASHHHAREEDSEQPSPSPRVPLVFVKSLALTPRTAAEQPGDATRRMGERQYPFAEELKVTLELPGGPDSTLDLARVGVPKASRL